MADIYDLLYGDSEDPIDRLLRQRRKPAQSASKQTLDELPDLTDEEREAAIQRLVSGPIGALQYAGETLDKPGRAVRGLLAGQPYELLNLIPFSDTLGITDPKDAVSGRDVLEEYGLLRRNRPGLDLGDVAGFGAEVLLDPLTYTGIGALTKAGKLAKAEGTLAKTLGSRVGAGQQALAELRVPFTELGVQFGRGDKATELAEGISRFADSAMFDNPLGRQFTTMFDPTIRGMKTRTGMKAAKNADARIKEAEAAAEMGAREMRRSALEKMEPLGGWTDAEDDMLRQLMEVSHETIGEPSSGLNPQKLWEQYGGGEMWVIDGPKSLQQQRAEVVFDTAMELKNATKELYKKAEAEGMPTQLLQDVISYGPRFHHQTDTPTIARRAINIYKRKNDEVFKGRNIKGFYGGTQQVNDLVSRHAGWGQNLRAIKVRPKDPLGTTTVQAMAPKYTKASNKINRQVRKFQKAIGNGEFIPAEVTDDAGNKIRGLIDSETGEVVRRTERGQISYNPEFPIYENPIPPMGDEREAILDVIAREYGAHDYITSSKEMQGEIRKTARWLNGLDRKKYVDEKNLFYNADPLTDYAIKAKQVARATTESQMLREVAKQHVSDFALDVARQGSSTGDFAKDGIEYVNVRNILQQAGFDTAEESNIWNLMGIDVADAKNKFLPKDIANDVANYAKSWHTNEVMGPVLETYDQLLNMTKAGLTQMWPAFHVRNLFSGMYYNQISGAYSNGRFSMFRDLKEATDLSVGKLTGAIADDRLKDVAGFSTWDSVLDSAASHGVVGQQVKSTETVGKQLAEMAATGPADRVKLINEGVPKGLGYSTTLNEAGTVSTTKLMREGKILEGSEMSSRIGGSNEMNAAAEFFPDVYNMGEPIRRIDPGIVIDEALRGKGVGQELYLKHMAEFPDTWFYNSQISDSAKNAVDALQKKGLAEVHWDGQYRLMRITNKGKQAANSGELTAAVRRPQGTYGKAARDWVKGFKDVPGDSLIGKAGGFVTTTVTQQGQKVGSGVEDALRLSHYIARLRQGYTPAEAARSVFKWHFDYTARGATPFERNVMKRVVPFYTFARNNLPLVMEQLIKQPGGAIAQSIRAANYGRTEADFVPGYLGEGTAIQIGSEEDGGTDRFISGFGLPFEEPFDHFAAPRSLSPQDLGDATSRTFQHLLGMVNPVPKAGLEMAFQKNLFTGKDFGAGYPYPTSSPYLNTLLSASPASRAITTSRKLIDERKDIGVKALDLFSGVKITDVSGGLPAARQRELTDSLADALRKNPRFGQFMVPYVRKSQAEYLTEDEKRLLQIKREEDARYRAAVKARQERESSLSR